MRFFIVAATGTAFFVLVATYSAEAAIITDIVGSETLTDNDSNDNTNASLTGMLATRLDNFYEFASDHTDFVTFNFVIPTNDIITSATLNIDLTDEDGLILTLRDNGTLIGSTSNPLGSQGSPGPWRAIGSTDSGGNGNKDHTIAIPSSFFASLKANGTLTLDGEWSGTTGVYASNRAKLTIVTETIPEPSTYLVFGGLALCFGLAGWWRKRKA